jgi:hypothetical protein
MPTRLAAMNREAIGLPCRTLDFRSLMSDPSASVTHLDPARVDVSDVALTAIAAPEKPRFQTTSNR